MRRQVIRLVLALATLTACQRMTPDATTPHSIHLHVLTPVVQQPGQFRAEAQVQNLTAGPLQVNAYVLSIASIALEIRDAHGNPVHHLPPPSPDAVQLAAGRMTLDPGAAVAVQLHDLSVSESAFPPGDYQVRLVGQGTGADTAVRLESAWVNVRRTAI